MAIYKDVQGGLGVHPSNTANGRIPVQADSIRKEYIMRIATLISLTLFALIVISICVVSLYTGSLPLDPDVEIHRLF